MLVKVLAFIMPSFFLVKRRDLPLFSFYHLCLNCKDESTWKLTFHVVESFPFLFHDVLFFKFLCAKLKLNFRAYRASNIWFLQHFWLILSIITAIICDVCTEYLCLLSSFGMCKSIYWPGVLNILLLEVVLIFGLLSLFPFLYPLRLIFHPL